jgi:hypothetical protein
MSLPMQTRICPVAGRVRTCKSRKGLEGVLASSCDGVFAWYKPSIGDVETAKAMGRKSPGRSTDKGGNPFGSFWSRSVEIKAELS